MPLAEWRFGVARPRARVLHVAAASIYAEIAIAVAFFVRQRVDGIVLDLMRL
jgi:hypothetical protein